MAWFYLIIAGIFEVVWAIAMKYSQGFSRLTPSLITLATMGVSFYFLAMASKVLPIGTAYAVWTGIGVIGAAIFGIVFMQEPKTVARILCLLLIMTGIIGMKMTTKV